MLIFCLTFTFNRSLLNLTSHWFTSGSSLTMATCHFANFICFFLFYFLFINFHFHSQQVSGGVVWSLPLWHPFHALAVICFFRLVVIIIVVKIVKSQLECAQFFKSKCKNGFLPQLSSPGPPSLCAHIQVFFKTPAFYSPSHGMMFAKTRKTTEIIALQFHEIHQSLLILTAFIKLGWE